MPAGASGRAPELLAAPSSGPGEATGLPAEVANEVRRLLTALLVADMKAYPVLPEEFTETRVIAVGGYNRAENCGPVTPLANGLLEKSGVSTQRSLFDILGHQ